MPLIPAELLLSQQFHKKQWLTLLIFLLMMMMIVSFSTVQGVVRPLEMKAYDTMIRFRPKEPFDQRIIVVGITDKDIDRYGVTIPDSILARLIEQISQLNPRVIGIDLHRNQPTGGGYEQLNQVLRSTSGIVGVEKTNQGSFDFPAIKPNKELDKKGMSSASELIEDQGGIVRRGYLYVNKEGEPLPSFGLKVALEYLKRDEINATSSDPKNHYLKLGKVVFPRLRHNQFFYELEDIDDYQNIINYRSSANNLQKLTLEQALQNNLDSSLIENKIVLIGAVAPSLVDGASTPLSANITDYTKEAFGVDIHASQASQIISAVKDSRKIIKLFPSTIEYAWLLIWIIVPSFYLFYKIHFEIKLYNILMQYTIANILAFLLIAFTGYISIFNFGYWLPTATPIFSLTVSFLFGFFYIEITREKQISKQLTRELKYKAEELEKVQRELIVKEKISAYGNFSVKIAHEIGNVLNSIQLANDNSLDKFHELIQFLEENSFLYEDMNEEDITHPLKIVEYINNKYLKIEKGINKASQITETIRLEYRARYENLTSLDLNQFIQAIVEDSYWIKEQNKQAVNPKIELNLFSEIPKVKIYPMALESVLVNLLANANYSLNKKLFNHGDIEYTPLITISTQDYPLTIEIKVKDNGEGINQENLEKIFIPFWTTKRAADGIGVGLFFCQQKINKHNGEIRVKSEFGKWTEFIICLPKSLT